MSNESKALELAARMDGRPDEAIICGDAAAAELRRQHTALQDLQTECAALRVTEENLTAQVESLRARIAECNDALQRIDTAVIGLLPTFEVAHEGGVTAAAQNIVDAVEKAGAQLAARVPDGWVGCVMVGHAKHHGGWCVLEETAPGEYVKIKGPFDTKELAQEAMRTPAPSQQAPVKDKK
jgi:hypothetical protein